MTPDDNYCFRIRFFAQENLLVDTNIMFLADLDALICRNMVDSLSAQSSARRPRKLMSLEYPN